MAPIIKLIFFAFCCCVVFYFLGKHEYTKFTSAHLTHEALTQALTTLRGNLSAIKGLEANARDIALKMRTALQSGDQVERLAKSRLEEKEYALLERSRRTRYLMQDIIGQSYETLLLTRSVFRLCDDSLRDLMSPDYNASQLEHIFTMVDLRSKEAYDAYTKLGQMTSRAVLESRDLAIEFGQVALRLSKESQAGSWPIEKIAMLTTIGTGFGLVVVALNPALAILGGLSTLGFGIQQQLAQYEQKQTAGDNAMVALTIAEDWHITSEGMQRFRQVFLDLRTCISENEAVLTKARQRLLYKTDFKVIEGMLIVVRGDLQRSIRLHDSILDRWFDTQIE